VKPTLPPYVREAGWLLLSYFVAAWLSIALARTAGSVSSIWLANAVAVAFLLTTTPRRWPVFLLCAAMANGAANLFAGDGFGRAFAFVPPNVAEILLAAFLLRRIGLADPAADRGGLRSPKAMLQLIVFGALLPQLAGATVGAAMLMPFGTEAYAQVWQSWYESSALGSVSTLALFVSLRRDRLALIVQELFDWRSAALACAAAGTTLLSLAHVPFPFIYAAIPVLVAATWVEMTATLAITFVVSLVIALSIGFGVFVLPPFTSQWEHLYVYTAYAAALIPAQLLAAAVAQMRDSQARLRTTMNELQRANEGLEQFVRIASHDLREPLNTIVQFSELIQHDHASRLPPDGQHWLALVQGAGSRMRHLLDDVLGYVRMRRDVSEPGVAVDLDAVVQDVIASLAGRIRETGATVGVGSLPWVRGRPGLLSLVFQNLLSNALKFVPADRTPRVTIDCQADAMHAVIGVADNGIGIAAEDLPKLFKPFARLHLRKHYDGTGLGLAMVREIVEAHGGSVAITSEPGLGTHVAVRLPLEDAASRQRATPTRY